MFSCSVKGGFRLPLGFIDGHVIVGLCFVAAYALRAFWPRSFRRADLRATCFVPTMFIFQIACDPVLFSSCFYFHVSVKIAVGWCSGVVVGGFERGDWGYAFFEEVVDILFVAAWLDSRGSAASYGAIEGTMKHRPNSQWI